jgi:hypothetical protein
MKITQDDQNTLKIENFPLGIGIFGWSMAVVCMGRIIYLLKEGGAPQKQLITLSVAVLISFFAGSAFAKKTVFIFNKGEKRLVWRRRGLLGRKEGSLFFNEINDVKIQKHSHTNQRSNTFSYRVALDTKNGILPVTENYSVGAEEKCQEVVSKIKSTLSK